MNSLLRNVPVSWGPRFEHGNAAAALTRTGPNAIGFEAPAHMALVMFTPQPGREVALNSDRKRSFLAPAGSIEIIPASADLFARWNTPKENLLVALDPRRLAALAEREFGRADFDLHPPRGGFVDRQALLIAGMIREELARPSGGNELYLDSLLTVFSTHVLRSYSSAARPGVTVHRGGLSARAWRDVNDHIHANPGACLCIEALARIARLSPSHFLRAFRQTTGQSPHQYVLQCRLDLAERLIASSGKPFAEIAALCGFSSHSHLSSVMKRCRGASPGDLRRQTGKPSRHI